MESIAGRRVGACERERAADGCRRRRRPPRPADTAAAQNAPHSFQFLPDPPIHSRLIQGPNTRTTAPSSSAPPPSPLTDKQSGSSAPRHTQRAQNRDSRQRARSRRMKLDLSMLEARAPRARAQEAVDMPVLEGCELGGGKGAFALPDVEDVSFFRCSRCSSLPLRRLDDSTGRRRRRHASARPRSDARARATTSTSSSPALTLSRSPRPLPPPPQPPPGPPDTHRSTPLSARSSS